MKRKPAKGELRRNKLHIPHPVRRLRRTGLVRSVVPPFPTRIASLDSRGSPRPFANPLKTTRKGAAAPFLGFSPGLGLCGICFQIVQTRDGCVFDRPAWHSKYSAIVSNVPCVEVRLCAIRDAALAGRTAFRLPYVKYSTGANEATRTVYRAIGKPNQTAARRAFLEGRAIGEWYAEAKCFFRRDSAICGPSASFLPILFWQDRKEWARGAAVTALRIEPRPRRIRNGPAEQNPCLRRKAHLCC